MKLKDSSAIHISFCIHLKVLWQVLLKVAAQVRYEKKDETSQKVNFRRYVI